MIQNEQVGFPQVVEELFLIPWVMHQPQTPNIGVSRTNM